MAASESKESPSDKPPSEGTTTDMKHSNSNDNNEEAAPSLAAVTVDPTETAVTTTAPMLLTYESSEQSEPYQMAKQYLKEGKLEQALELIQDAFQELESKIGAQHAFHEAMAPFYYLYGTTLLYWIEESGANQAMTTMDDDNTNNDTLVNHDDADAEYPNNDAEDQPHDANNEMAEDAQIAWENLELARTILLRMTPLTDKLRLDLAQVCLRAADLQKMNGHYQAAVTDYEACLRQFKTNALVGPYDRKRADAHYNLGLMYHTLLAHTTNKKNNADDEDIDANNDNNIDTLDEATKELYRGRSYHHSFQCGQIFCAQIAILCGVEPLELFARAEQEVANYKTTGEDDEPFNSEQQHHANKAEVSWNLKALRKHVGTMEPPQEDQETFRNLLDVLDELQEFVDEAENSELGMKSTMEMKSEITAAVAGQTDDIGTEKAYGSTTFGFGSAAAETATAEATVMSSSMVVKKKRKLTESLQDDSIKPAAKKAATE
jgi:tetratricopeptide (TPR) repeat protein